jgi:hypothetical protein
MKTGRGLSQPNPLGYGARESITKSSSLFHETLEKGSSGDDTLKGITVEIPMEYDQRVIIKFLFNGRCDANQIVDRLEAQFHEEVHSLRGFHFRTGEIKRGREDLHDAQ